MAAEAGRVRVLVAHPGRQHSHQTALALESAGWLAAYWSGVPHLASHARWVPGSLRARLIPHDLIEISPAHSRWLPWALGLRKAGERFPGAVAGQYLQAWSYRLFDARVARLLRSAGKLTAVIAYENAALQTFRAARELGLVTVLDAASVHHSAQNAAPADPALRAFLRKANLQKDAEIALADHILTASAMARDTYLADGIPGERVHEVPLGADLRVFTAGSAPSVAASRPLRFLYVGKITRQKGIDTLLQAFITANTDASAQLSLVGPPGDAQSLVAARAADGIEVHGSKPPRELAGHYRNADCLVLPSRFDSFGMVVAEALACGLPVIVSDMVGAKQLVHEGRNGWVVPVGDVDALAARLRWCMEHRHTLTEMRVAAAQSAQQASWPEYHQRLLETLGGILQA